MSLTVNQIIDIVAPQYSSDSDLTNTITLATQRTSESAFGVNYEYAIALRTAHILTLRDMNKNGVLSGLGGVTGNVTSKREGNTSITFGSISGIQAINTTKSVDLTLTRYGLDLLGLINGNITSFSVNNYTGIRNAYYGISEEE